MAEMILIDLDVGVLLLLRHLPDQAIVDVIDGIWFAQHVHCW